MAAKFSTKERKAIADLSLEQLVNTTRNIGLTQIGVNHRLLLAEFALRLDVPTDAVSLTIVRDENSHDPTEGSHLWHWGVYSEERIEVLRGLPERRWNNGVKCNTCVAASEADPVVFGRLKNLYAKSVIITETDYRVDVGQGVAEWINPLLYKLNDEPKSVNLAEVLKGFYQLRPTDGARYIAVHGEYDEQYRTLFDESLMADRQTLAGIEITTRHELLMFRLPQFDGKLRYIVYSATNNTPVEVLFADSKQTSQRLAQFKETQQRHGVPLIEGATIKGDKLPSRPSGTPDPTLGEPSR